MPVAPELGQAKLRDKAGRRCCPSLREARNGFAGGFVIIARTEAETSCGDAYVATLAVPAASYSTDPRQAIAWAAGAETVEQVPRCPGRSGGRLREYAGER
jgi:hypothetical protein